MGSGIPTLPSSAGRGLKRRASETDQVVPKEAEDAKAGVTEEKKKKGGEGGGGGGGGVEGKVGGRRSCAAGIASASAPRGIEQNSSLVLERQGKVADASRADAERAEAEVEVNESTSIAALASRNNRDKDDVVMGQMGGQDVVGKREEGRENTVVEGRADHVEEKRKEQQQGERESTVVSMSMDERPNQEADQNDDDGLQRKTLVVTRHGQTLESCRTLAGCRTTRHCCPAVALFLGVTLVTLQLSRNRDRDRRHLKKVSPKMMSMVDDGQHEGGGRGG
ncbi:hypothetical protein CBR_g8348 [Chara braunii]|uniref:Uncharacterized protein n=1 Tax=Chara braunii TaxID=69332 RepID=A0A388KLW9_CHABU|nr:hypothetical protein CBR_g8348 [Chara braunii]|eukprot:GBG71049.1 hypothetical protein CBR_g8348 [Chara braunii]